LPAGERGKSHKRENSGNLFNGRSAAFSVMQQVLLCLAAAAFTFGAKRLSDVSFS